jgi:hypothetical protein
MRRIRGMLLFGISTLLTACVPVFGHFYVPDIDVPEGKVEQPDCHGKVGPADTIRLSYGPTVISIYPEIDYPASGKNKLIVDFGLPEGDRLDAAWDELQATDPSGKLVSETPRIERFYFGSSSDQKLTDIPLGTSLTGETVDKTRGTGYEISIDLTKLDAERFILHFPAITLDGKTYPSFDIRYQRQSGFWMEFLNC